MANERTPADIQREIEAARSQLAVSLDQLAERTSPKRLADQAKRGLIESATSPKGKKVIAGTTAAIIGLIILSRRRSNGH